jgi:hypothetical protein
MSRLLRVAVVVVALVALGVGWAAANSAAREERALSTTPTADPTTTTTAPAPPTTEPDDGRPTVTLFADSLGFESAQVVTNQLGPGVRFDSSSLPGVALCDLIGALERSPEKTPDLALVQFSGNNITECMRGPDGQPLDGAAAVDKYAADIETVIEMLRARGSQVVLASSPRTSLTGRAEEINTITAWTAIDWQARGEPVTYTDTAATLLNPDRSFAGRMPCLPEETPERGCGPDGTIAVRSDDGTHFCPQLTGGLTLCPVWSSGAYRFGLSLTAAIEDHLAPGV